MATHVVTGTITDPRTIALDEAIQADGRVRVCVEVLPEGPKMTIMEALDLIRARQKERGYVPPTAAEIEAEWADYPNKDVDRE